MITEAVSAIYIISSAMAVLAFLFIARILHLFGNTKLVVLLAIIKVLALIGLGFADTLAEAVLYAIIFMMIDPLIFLNIDIFSESLIGSDETSTGAKRGMALSLMSVAAALAPLALGLIVGSDDSNLNLVYFYSAGVLALFIMITAYVFSGFKDPEYHELKVMDAISSFWREPNVRYVFLSHLLLQIFFVYTAIYIPLYLATEIGLPWNSIGIILAIGLFAYVFVEYPAGYLADKVFGEKEMMTIGFIILTSAVAVVPLIATNSLLFWAVLMFYSRVGASLVEVTTESYFFKHVQGSDANIMSFFRLTRPLAGIIGACIGGASLLLLPFNVSFTVLALLMIPGIYFSQKIIDTR